MGRGHVTHLRLVIRSFLITHLIQTVDEMDAYTFDHFHKPIEIHCNIFGGDLKSLLFHWKFLTGVDSWVSIGNVSD
jgi:hypothetical protein